MSILGNKISSLRKSKGFSQEKLAEESKINLRTLQRIETGKTKPHGETLTRICEALNISVEEVLNNKARKAPYYLKLTAFSLLILCSIVFLYKQFSPSPESDKTLITKRIQYDVPIYSHDLEYFWWVENMEVSDRITFVTNLFDKALAGNVKICDIYLNPVDPEGLKSLYTDTLIQTLMKPVPPYNEFDTIITRFIEPAEIDYLRFQEEWTYNEENLVMEKRVLGICPVIRVQLNGGIGDRPLFWIYFDDALLDNEVFHSAL